MDGGHAHPPDTVYDLGGGGGGIIQIVAPMGSLGKDTLSMKHGNVSWLCDTAATNGHFLLKGNYSYIHFYLAPGFIDFNYVHCH